MASRKFMLFKLPFLLACVTSLVRVVESSIFSDSLSRTVLSTFLLSFSLALTWRIWQTPYFPEAYVSSFTTALLLMIMVFAIELISLFVAVEEAYECSSRLSWCGSPDHFTVSVLLSVISHCVCFVMATKGSRRRNRATTAAAVLAWLATTATQYLQRGFAYHPRYTRELRVHSHPLSRCGRGGNDRR